MGINVYPPASSSLQPYEQIFTKSGRWTKPAGVKTCEVTVVGGGGGNAGSTYNASVGGGGGYIKKTIDVSDIASASVIVGSGGRYANNNNFGGTSSFGSKLFAYGGYGGKGSDASAHVSVQTGGYAHSGVAESVGDNLSGIAAGKHLPVGSYTQSTTNIPTQYCYKKVNGVYCAITGNSSNTLTSTDGLTWTLNTGVLGATSNSGKIASIGGRFLITQNSSSSVIYTSTNGVSWTTATLPSTGTWSGVVDNGTVAMAQLQGSTSIAISTNATTWTASTMPNSASIGSAGPYLYSSNFGGSLSYSTNGTSWTSCTGTVPTNATRIEYLPNLNRYVALIENSGSTIYVSANGIAWSQVTLPTSSWQGLINTYQSQFIIGETIFCSAYYNADLLITTWFQSVDGGQSWTEFNGFNFMVGRQSNQGVAMNVRPHTSIWRALPIENNRHSVSWTIANPAVSPYYIASMMFSDSLTGGYTGTLLGYGGGTGASAGAFGDNTTIMALAWNGSFNTSYFGSGNSGGSPEGFCKGQGQSTNGTYSYPPLNIGLGYGDGAKINSLFGGQGIVIVRWYA